MNPSDPNLPRATKDTNTAQVNGIDQVPAFPDGNEIFIVTPPTQKPLNKRSASVVAIGSIIGVILLLVVIIFTLIGAATGVANTYRRLALIQINKISAPLSELEPSAVLNQRNIDQPLQAISLSQQSQPELQNVLLVSGWSSVYSHTQTIQRNVQRHYTDIDSYSQDLKSLLAFDDTIKGIFTQEPNLAATIKPSDSLTIRSVSGSYQDFASQLKNQLAPTELTHTKTQLMKIYNQKAAIYVAWAKQVEAGNAGYQPTAQAALLVQTASATTLTVDKNYINQLKPSFIKLINQQKVVKSELGS